MADPRRHDVGGPPPSRLGGDRPAATEALLREVRWSDIPALAELEHALFAGDAWSEAAWWAELAARPRRHYAAYEDEGRIAAYGGIDVRGEVSDLMTLAVGPVWRGAGLGAGLLRELEAVASERGASAMMLEVRADNDAASRLYQGAGYEVLDVRRRYYQPDGVDALVMRRLLTGGRR